MPNPENLKPIKHLDPKKASEMGKIGGKRSVEAKRKRKMFRELCDEFVNSKVTDKTMLKRMKELGVDDENVTKKMALVISLWNKAFSGDVRAFEVFRDTIGEKPQDNIILEDKRENPFEGMTTEELREMINNVPKGDSTEKND